MTAFSAIRRDRRRRRALLTVAVAFAVVVSALTAPGRAGALSASPGQNDGGPTTYDPSVGHRASPNHSGLPATRSGASQTAPPVTRLTGRAFPSAQDSGFAVSRTVGPNIVDETSGPYATAAEGAGFTEVSVGGSHSCGLRTDGTIRCWGDNFSWSKFSWDTLSWDSNLFDRTTAPSGSFTQVSAGGEHSCAIRTSGTIVCWGNIVNTNEKATPPPGTFSSVSANWNHSCAIRTSGTIVCWGNNDHEKATAPPGPFTHVSAGSEHSCAIRTNGTIVCWGNNDHGQATAPSGTFTQVSAGFWYSCGLRSDGSVECWGNYDNEKAIPPSGTFSSVSVPCAVRTNGTIVCWGNNEDEQATAPSGTFTQVSAGWGHSCAVRTNGTIVCWGDNEYGQATAPSAPFTQISASYWYSCGLRSDASVVCWKSSGGAAPLGTFTQVSTGTDYLCGLRSDGSAECWGNNDHGQASAPSGSFTQISARSQHSCGVRSDSSVECWGSNGSGQATAPSGSFTQVSAGYGHSCGLRSDGSAECWGWNNYGQATAPSGSFTQVSAGSEYSCGLRSDGSAECWGGYWATAPSGSFTQVSAGYGHSCGLRTGGTIECWGHMDEWPTNAPSGSFTQVSAGFEYSCGLRSDGSVFCWGREYLVVLSTDGGDGSVPGVTGGGPGQVVGVDFELGEYGRNLFWTPLIGFIEYEIDAREAGEDRAEYQGGITCLDTLERCEYLLDRDTRTSETFRAAPEVRVRAVNEAGAGPWSEWVSVGESPPGRVEGLWYGWSLDGLVLFWDPLDRAQYYEVSVPGNSYFEGHRCTRRVCEFVIDGDRFRNGAFYTATEYRVRAKNKSGKGPWSEFVTVDVSGRPRPVSDLQYSVERLALEPLAGGKTQFSRDGVRWRPVRGADSYDLEFQHQRRPGQFVQQPVLVRDLTGEEGWAGCRHKCFYEFLRNPELQVRVRVRATSEQGAGQWSDWVWSIREPRSAPVITKLVPEYGFGDDDVVVHWSHAAEAAGYRVEWRYVDYGEARADQITAAGNAERVEAVLDWLADNGNYRVVKPGSASVGLETSHRVKSVIDTREDKKYVLEFRVVALGDGGIEQPSDWVRWNTQQLRDKLEQSSACGVLDVLDAGNKVFDIVNVVLALYSGGLGAGVLTALKSQLSLGPDGVKAAQVLAGCFEDHHPIDVLRELSPMVGKILDITGMTAVVKRVTCGNHYLATNFRDKNFDVDDIDGLLEECYT